MRQKAILRILEDQAPSIIPRARQKLQCRLYEAEQGEAFTPPASSRSGWPATSSSSSATFRPGSASPTSP
eukprot:9060552-Alexandrium_andersonii.AAC.1